MAWRPPLNNMCGIAGILGTINPFTRQALRRMTDAIAHRGPDSDGFWESAQDERGRGCLLGHRRLSIIDLSHAADQPMTDVSAEGARTLVFNGEIYNFKDLRRDLVARGETFQSTGDTAVMLRLLAREGPSAVAQLRGMFAFAMWDERLRRLMLARDPLGIKPLYVCRNPSSDGEWSLAFASEVRAILASGLIERPRLNRRAVASVIWNGFVAGPDTVVEGIESVRPGEIRVLHPDASAACARQYWQMPTAVHKGTIDEHQLRDVLADSVARHLISDVPIGIFLSSGVDSSAVANLAQKASATPVHTFTLGFEEPQYNEGQHARRIAEAIGTHHHECVLTGQQFAGALDTAISTLDQPTFDGLNSYYISKAVRDAGLTVALVGTGGDELFGGYTSFRVLPSMLRWQRRSRLLPRRAKLAGALLVKRVLSGRGDTSAPPQTRWAKFPDMVNAGQDLVALYQLGYGLFLPEFQEELLLEGVPDSIDSGLNADLAGRLANEVAGHSALSAVSVLEQRMFLGERLMRDTDAASMAVSLETRLPLVDSVVTEAVNRLPDDERYGPLGKKALLRKIGLEGLDPMLFARPKSGFVLPFDRWIRESLGARMDETMRDASLARAVGLNGDAVSRLWAAFQAGAPGLYWSRIWALYILIRWCHQYGVLL